MDTSPKPIAGLFQPEQEDDLMCGRHGTYVSRGRLLGGKVRWSACPRCADENRIKDELERAARLRELDAEAQKERARKAVEESIESALIPARFRLRTFESFVADTEELGAAYRTVKAYADGFAGSLRSGAGLILSGPPGTGKSHLAAATLLQLAPDHVCLYATVSQVIRAVRDTWRKDSDRSEREVIKHLGMEVDLLVLDEVGVQYGTDAEKNLLFDILDRRYSEMRPTILISNLHGEALKEVLGDRVYDRMRETQRMVIFTGDSYRAKARAS